MLAVLLTRPQTLSEALAAKMWALGYACVIEPLLTITPVHSPMPDFTTIQAVMVTSGNAFAALPQVPPSVLDLPCFCVGAKTADLAHAYGFKRVLHAFGDGTELARLIEATLIDRGKGIMHIAGRDIDCQAGDALTQANFTIDPWVVYDAQSVTTFAPSTLESIRHKKIDVVLLFSRRTALTFTRLIRSHQLEACCATLDAIGLSVPVTSALDSLPWRTLTAASHPTEDAVIARLKDLHPIA
jgi:uroporphyrinogen-III synthase